MTASLFTFESLYRAWLDCRRTKRSSRPAMEFEQDAERSLIELARALKERTWHPSPSTCFVARNDKYREVFAAPFTDRIVHHFLVPRLEAIWERMFIHDSYACRRCRGTLAASERLHSFTARVTSNGTRRAWFLQLDIRSFFPSVNRSILLEILLSRLDDPELRWLTETIVLHDPSENPVFGCSQRAWRHIPIEKSLFGSRGERGLPIGNLTSQFFANVYLNGLDQFVKHELKCIYYLRYVDDFILLHRDPEVLLAWQAHVARYLEDRLELKLHPSRCCLKPVSCGMDFLGYVTHRTHVLVRRKTVDRLRRKLDETTRLLCRPVRNGVLVRVEPDEYDMLQAVLASYLGLFGHADTKGLVESLFEKHPILDLLFERKEFTLRKKWVNPERPRNFREQYMYFRSRFEGLLAIQVGSHLEFYEEDAETMKHYCSFRLIEPRRGFCKRCGTSISNLDRLLMNPVDMMIVTQTGRCDGNVMERRLHSMCLHAKASERILAGMEAAWASGFPDMR